MCSMPAKTVQLKRVDGAGLRIGIVHTRWNIDVIETLRGRCRDSLLQAGVLDEDVVVMDVAGAWELPYATKKLAQSGDVDVIVAIGCLIKGETMHFEYIADAVSHGLMNVQLTTGVPVVLGLLTCLTMEQAQERAAQNGKDHGFEWGSVAVEIARL